MPPKKQPDEDGMVAVMLPSGGAYRVFESEFQWFNQRRERYLKDNSFTNMSDLQDVDRLLMTELLVWRWQIWLSQKRDYWGDPIDDNAIQKAVKDHSSELRQLKKSLSLDKESRDKERGEGSVTQYLDNLRTRAKHFMYMRNAQHAKSIELFHELKSLVIFHDNCTEDERRSQKITTEELLDWVRDVAIPEFDKIDEEFRKTEQTFWIRDM